MMNSAFTLYNPSLLELIFGSSLQEFMLKLNEVQEVCVEYVLRPPIAHVNIFGVQLGQHNFFRFVNWLAGKISTGSNEHAPCNVLGPLRSALNSRMGWKNARVSGKCENESEQRNDLPKGLRAACAGALTPPSAHVIPLTHTGTE